MARQKKTANPYSDRRTRGNGEAPGINTGTAVYYSKYAVPDIPDTTDPDYELGYATELDPTYESGTTPDPIRTGKQEPPINDPNNRRYNARREADFHERHSVEEYTLDWRTRQQTVAGGQNPLWEQDRLPTRPTAEKAPMPYMFSRPWHIPRYLHDIDPSIENHISMADHRREFEIFGMRSQDRMGVNTYRLDPQPWDQGLYPVDQVARSETGSGNVAQSGNRSYRL